MVIIIMARGMRTGIQMIINDYEDLKVNIHNKDNAGDDEEDNDNEK